MTFQIDLAPYRRPFAIPLRTATGVWYEREGILLRLTAPDGRVGYGEVAPLPAFGGETLAAAEACLRALGPTVTTVQLGAVPVGLSATRFALGSAVWALEEPEIPFRLVNTALLPTGEQALEAIWPMARAGFTTFKLKIGVGELNAELALVDALLNRLPVGGRLRLDANGSLDPAQLESWLGFLAGPGPLDFLEQPLPPGSERAMEASARRSGVVLALDESIVSATSLEALLAEVPWSGPVVLKASLLGPPQTLLERLRGVPSRRIFSSVFETGIGLHANLRLAALAGAGEAVGFGTIAFFDDPLNGYAGGATLDAGELPSAGRDHLWETVCSEFVRT